MLVHPIITNNTTFGYNRNLNNELIATLEHAKKNKAHANYIKDLLIATNRAEDSIRDAQKRNKPQLKDMLITSFMPMKILLAGMLTIFYPEFNYRSKEIESYKSELEQEKSNNDEEIKDKTVNLEDEEETFDSDWRSTLIDVLKKHEDDFQNTILLNNMSKLLQKKFPDKAFEIELAGDENNYKRMSLQEFMDQYGPVDDDYDDDDIDDADKSSFGNFANGTERAKAGKDKVITFEPKGEALKGFDGLGGMEELKTVLTDKVVDFLKDPIQAVQDREDYGTELPNAVLYGPPGCGKTTITEHLSVEAGVPLFILRPGVFGSTFVNGTEQNIEAAFDYVASVATPEKPAIMFIDDIDTIVGSRDELSSTHKKDELGTFLTRIQNAHNDNTLVIAATNKFDNMDTAVKRRFDQQIYVGLPDKEARISLLKFFFNANNKGKVLANDDKAIEKFADELKSFPISAIKNIVSDACDIPRREAKEARARGEIVRRDVNVKDVESIINKPETQNKRINENRYKTKETGTRIGFQAPKN